jgi:hypothetical protein
MLPQRIRRRIALSTLCTATVLCPALLPATVEEQRARLPPPTRCEDPIEGVWRAQRFFPDFEDWGVFTLRVRRTAPGAATLTGTVDTEYWNGPAGSTSAPPCAAGVRHFIVDQDARGRFENGVVDVVSFNVRLRREFCPGSFGAYNPDTFAGRVDPALQEFQAVSNDGGRVINEPTVFRRIGCLDAVVAPHPFVAPPPLTPPRSARGCARR